MIEQDFLEQLNVYTFSDTIEIDSSLITFEQ